MEIEKFAFVHFEHRQNCKQPALKRYGDAKEFTSSCAAAFDFGDVTQELSGEPRSNWQVAYEEQEIGENRFVFFSHYLDTAKPLLTSVGPLELPPESPLPEHLHVIEYWPT